MVNWTPDGAVGEFFDLFAAHAPGPPPVAWGSEGYVRQLFRDRVEWLNLRRAKSMLDQFASPQAFCDFYKKNFGPTIATYTALVHDPQRVADLDHDFLEFAARHGHSRSGQAPVYEFEYLLAVAMRAPPPKSQPARQDGRHPEARAEESDTPGSSDACTAGRP
jgi:2-polyprenyl-6-hydroxyphenyl methylase/3-demethylubiquinone-9 3-methyltransferase